LGTLRQIASTGLQSRCGFLCSVSSHLPMEDCQPRTSSLAICRVPRKATQVNAWILLKSGLTEAITERSHSHAIF
jgi:hypothetical protein